MRVAVIAGDGVGREVIAEARRVLEAVARRFSIPLTVREFPFGADHYLATGETLPEPMFATFAADYDAILLGAVGDPRVPDNRHARDILLGLRKRLDLFINLRPVRLIDERHCPLKGKAPSDIDFVIFRENTEGAYADVGRFEAKGTPGEVAVNEDINSRRGVERIIRAAFEYAATRGNLKVTMCDKANALRFAHDLWRRTFAAVSAEFPAVPTDVYYVDALAMRLVRTPEDFKVIVTCNLFGDILSDLGAEIAGGMGLAPSANLHPGRCSLFEPVHGSAPDIAGRGIANPMAAILSVAMMLESRGYGEAARVVDERVRAAIIAGVVTRDLGGTASTSDVGTFVARL